MSTKVKTRVLLLSDTHYTLPAANTSSHVAYRMPLPEADVAIHTGDLTMTGTLEEHERAIELLKLIRAPLKIVIPGNHDLTLDRENYADRCERWGVEECSDSTLDHIKNLYTDDTATSAGIHYIEEGMRTFRLINGALLTVYASAYTPEFCDWAFAYPRTKDRFNSKDASNPIPSYQDTKPSRVTNQQGRTEDHVCHRDIDILMTHGPPQTILDETHHQKHNVGCRHLLRAVERCRPVLHCFGHIHEAWGAQLRQWQDIPANTGQHDHMSATPHTDIQNENDSPHQWRKSKTGTNIQDLRLQVDHDAALNDMGVQLDLTSLTRGRETAFVNSSIMSLTYKPVQAPWIVDVQLDRE